MNRIISWLKTARWILFVILAVAGGILLSTIHHLFAGPRSKLPIKLPDVSPEMRRKVEQAQEEALIAKTRAKATAVRDKQELEQILQIDDGVERRKRLADKLRSL